jgi:hypothetical protein
MTAARSGEPMGCESWAPTSRQSKTAGPRSRGVVGRIPEQSGIGNASNGVQLPWYKTAERITHFGSYGAADLTTHSPETQTSPTSLLRMRMGKATW